MKLRILVLGLFFTIACTHSSKSPNWNFADYRNPAADANFQPINVNKLPPVLLGNKIGNENFDVDPKDVTKYNIPPQLLTAMNRYFSFLGVNPKTPGGRTVLTRLMDSSTRFLVCEDIEDWECLEADPILAPVSEYRRDTVPGLGKRILTGQDKLNIQYFFTKQYDVDPKNRIPEQFLVRELAKKISGTKWDTISMALYGVDDIDGTMKPFYDALVKAKQSGTFIRGVFDDEGLEKVSKEKILFSHRGNVSPEPNFFTVVTEDINHKKFFTPRTIGRFQYDDTPAVIELLNQGVKTEAETNARLEWPITSKIMHNKFFVFTNKELGKSAIWTGTANLAQTCMGDESNANMAVYIEDKNIAKTYYSEFQEMFEFSGVDRSGKLKGIENPNEIPMGKFHEDKRPNTQRYFAYNDGTEVRVHFAPTDDGEHRAIIPALLSAREGDQVRISMFGSAGGPGGGIQGLEVVRAIQYAVEKGANVRIVFDNLTNAGSTSWIYNKFGNIRNLMAYSQKPKGSLDFRVSAWPGLDHEKVATITRKTASGMLPETIIIGSQNWTTAGNDDSDENMITIRNRRIGVPAAEDFNKEFDTHLWKAAQVLKPKPAKAPTVVADTDGTAIEVDGDEAQDAAIDQAVKEKLKKAPKPNDKQ